jgi:hypothetical protein
MHQQRRHKQSSVDSGDYVAPEFLRHTNYNSIEELTMNHITKLTLLSVTLSGLLAVPSVQADPTDVTVLAKTSSEQPKNCDRWEGKEQRLETLKADLKLQATQEAAWTDWSDKIKGDRKDLEERRKNEESWASLPAPVRMEKMLSFSKEHIAKQETRLAATRTFYALLTPEQRLIFDKDFNFEHHERFGKHVKK